MNLEGGLEIILQPEEPGEPAEEVVHRVTIHSTRPVGASRMLESRPVKAVLNLLPKLFTVCGMAQAVAGVRAMEMASATEVDPEVTLQRCQLVALETIKEHLWQILLQWPKALGQEPDQYTLAAVVKRQRQFNSSMIQQANPLQMGGGDGRGLSLTKQLAPLQQQLQEQLLGSSIKQWLAMQDEPALMAWMQSSSALAARYLNHVVAQGMAAAGRCERSPLPILDERIISAAMAEPAFMGLPQWDGRCHESSSLTRTTSPLLAELQARYGNGLLVRLVARLTEVCQLLTALLDDAHTERLMLICPVPQRINDPGIGVVEAARGRLIHRVSLQGEQVMSYAILAPTEWNFHPAGVAASALASLQGDEEALQQQAELLIAAIDPCVGYQLKVVAHA
uniref:Ni,Fe-hydrogenase I large subunit n=1 Tax=Magnetococcus massalia (strain MO-1) TaxID=451514 RepID=A0A1S7LEC3_MAGMO|nr:Conserved protein of unknown function [Candidatus Magnetococcus massalia]